MPCLSSASRVACATGMFPVARYLFALAIAMIAHRRGECVAFPSTAIRIDGESRRRVERNPTNAHDTSLSARDRRPRLLSLSESWLDSRNQAAPNGSTRGFATMLPPLGVSQITTMIMKRLVQIKRAKKSCLVVKLADSSMLLV